MQASFTIKGQLTIHKKVRSACHPSRGDKVEFILDKNQQSARITPLHQSAVLLKSILPKPEKTVSLEDMDHTVRSKAQL